MQQCICDDYVFNYIIICNSFKITVYIGGEDDTPPNPPSRNQSLMIKSMSDPNMLEYAVDSNEHATITDNSFV